MLTKPPVGALLLLSIALNAIAFAYIWKAGPTVDGANSSQGDTAVLMTQHSELQDRMAQLQETVDNIGPLSTEEPQSNKVQATSTDRPEAAWLEVAQRVGPPVSDKITDHAYNRMYDHFLSPIRHKDLKMLEIGLGCDMNYGPGASVKIWDAFLSPNSELWEAEFDAGCVKRYRSKLGRVKALTGDQGDSATLDRWLQETGGNFDFVVDDGGHRNDQILNSFAKLWPAVKPGGYYFIEDMQVGRHTNHQRPSNGAPVVADVIHQWNDQLIMEPGMHTHATAKARDHKLPSKVLFILCQDEACVIAKCPEDDTKFHCK